jgi:hypothetical protein
MTDSNEQMSESLALSLSPREQEPIKVVLSYSAVLHLLVASVLSLTPTVRRP